jgi:hypothetical protein
MAAIQVQLVRDNDRDQLLKALSEQGLEPEVLNGTDLASLELRCENDDSDGFCGEVVHAIEQWLAENDIPLVAQRVADRIVLRPPTA